jgi:hypothetical protein
MSESDRAVVRACLDQVMIGLVEAREVRTWWTLLSEKNRQAWKDFAASVVCYRRALAEDFLNQSNPLSG